MILAVFSAGPTISVGAIRATRAWYRPDARADCAARQIRFDNEGGKLPALAAPIRPCQCHPAAGRGPVILTLRRLAPVRPPTLDNYRGTGHLPSPRSQLNQLPNLFCESTVLFTYATDPSFAISIPNSGPGLDLARGPKGRGCRCLILLKSACIPKGHTHHLSYGLFHGFATFSGGSNAVSLFRRPCIRVPCVAARFDTLTQLVSYECFDSQQNAALHYTTPS